MDNRKTLLLCALVALCEGIDLQAAGLAAAGISAEFKPAADELGTFFGASTFGLFLGAFLMTGVFVVEHLAGWVSVTFAPVTTRELKLDVELKPGFSAGILEWTLAKPK